MRNIKKSVPYKTSDKSWYYQHCLEETYKIFLDISQVIISHDIVINRNAAPLSSVLASGQCSPLRPSRSFGKRLLSRFWKPFLLVRNTRQILQCVCMEIRIFLSAKVVLTWNKFAERNHRQMYRKLKMLGAF